MNEFTHPQSRDLAERRQAWSDERAEAELWERMKQEKTMYEDKSTCDHGCGLPAVVYVDGQNLCHECGEAMQTIEAGGSDGRRWRNNL